MTGRVIVSNRDALRSLYGEDGFRHVEAYLNTFAASYRGEGYHSQIVWLDDKNRMDKIGARAVDTPTSAVQNKGAVDAVYKKLAPYYLTIVGGPDIVAQPRLKNPVKDRDPDVPSDLPYASETGWPGDLPNISSFLNVNRRVGRIAGITGSKDPSYLVKAIEGAILTSPRNRDVFTEMPFAVSADDWKVSSRLTIKDIFGGDRRLNLSPPDGPVWPKELANRLCHFVNCHGGDGNHRWFGQGNKKMPVAFDSQLMEGALKAGVVMSTECCYGAQLYSVAANPIMPICNRYLSQGASAFCGSTTTAYGPANARGAADHITGDFLVYLLDGNSAGDSMLLARWFFKSIYTTFEPVSLKTFAQFYLLGDAAAVPVLPLSEEERQMRNERRLSPLNLPKATDREISIADPDPSAQPPQDIYLKLISIADREGVKEPEIVTCPVTARESMAGVRREVPAEERVYLIYDRGGDVSDDAPFETTRIISVTERNGEIVSEEIYESKGR